MKMSKHPIFIDDAFFDFKKNENDQYVWEVIQTNEINNQCIKLSKIFFLYKKFPKLENLYNYLHSISEFWCIRICKPFYQGRNFN